MSEEQTPPVKTQDQIVDELRRLKGSDDDFFGFRTGDLITWLDYEHAKEFLKPECSEEEWAKTHTGELTREKILKTMEDYMSFAWDKARNCRGISAARSMEHYTAWMFLIGDEGTLGDLTDYEHYGKDNLRRICEKYGWNADQWDDGVRVNSESEIS